MYNICAVYWVALAVFDVDNGFLTRAAQKQSYQVFHLK